MTNSSLFVLRQYNAEDKSFIAASFLKGLYYGNSFYRMIDKNTFMREYHKVIEAWLSSPNVEIKVACDPLHEYTIRGYSILSKDNKTLHWVMVKTDWRGNKIGKALLPVTIEQYSHFSDSGLKLNKKTLVFNPFT